MNLYTHCNSCKKDIKIKSSASTRPDLQMEKGDELKVNCQNCGNLKKKHVNDIKAEPDTKIIGIGAAIGILVTIFLWMYLGVIGTVGMIIPALFWQQQRSAVKGFNSYFIRRK